MIGRVYRRIRVPVLALTGVALGWLGGLLWFEAFGPSFGDFGSGGEGWAEVFRGTLAGGVTGALFGWLKPWAPADRIGRTLFVLLGSVAAAILLVVGVSYLGDWTNADGPGDFAAYVGILGIPAAAMIAWAMWRLTRRLAPSPPSASA